MDFELLKSYGIDCEKGIARCLNDKNLYKNMLMLFLKDDSFTRAQSAYAQRDYGQLFRCLHELKGACGNADMTALYTAVSPLVEYLRESDVREETVQPMMERVEQAYQLAGQGILLASGERHP